MQRQMLETVLGYEPFLSCCESVAQVLEVPSGIQQSLVTQDHPLIEKKVSSDLIPKENRLVSRELPCWCILLTNKGTPFCKVHKSFQFVDFFLTNPFQLRISLLVNVSTIML